VCALRGDGLAGACTCEYQWGGQKISQILLLNAISTRQHPPHNRLHQLLAVRLRAQESGFELIAEGCELVYFGDDAARTYKKGTADERTINTFGQHLLYGAGVAIPDPKI